MQPTLQLDPHPGHLQIRHVGDRLRFSIRATEAGPDWRGILRTTLGGGPGQRAEATRALHPECPAGDGGWRDLPMQRGKDGWSIDLRLTEPGFYLAKPRLADPQGNHYWPDGDDCGISVHPTWTRSHNSIYCAFPRMFGPNRTERITEHPLLDQQCRVFEEHGYAVLPPSGTLRDLKAQCPHIFERLGCSILHLLPINPTPTTYARMGRFGSPYAALDFTAIDPALVEFDKRTTAIDQFKELVDTVHRYRGKLFLDLALNHTGWGSTLQNEHPEWFVRNKDGSFHSPGAWGTTWEDLVELDHRHVGLWRHLSDAILTWCARGVDGFRCDAGYMIPLPVWRAIIARVQGRYPDTVFLLEGLGGAWQVTADLLSLGGMQWAYSELFQNYTPTEIATYLDHCATQSAGTGVLVHYSETHDNDRLAKKGRQWSLMRNQLCALTSTRGAYGFTCGVEWLADEQIRVHRSRGLNWDSEDHLVDELGHLNRILAQHPCFFDEASCERISPDDLAVMQWLRRAGTRSDDQVLLIVANVTDQARQWSAPPSWTSRFGNEAVDLLTGHGIRLEGELPAQTCCCIAPSAWTDWSHGTRFRNRMETWDLVMQILSHRFRPEELGAIDFTRCTTALAEQPLSFLTVITRCQAEDLGKPDFPQVDALGDAYRPVIIWNSIDAKRITPVPAGHWLVITDDEPFRAVVEQDDYYWQRTSINGPSRQCVILPPDQLRGEARLTMDRFCDAGVISGAVRFLSAVGASRTDPGDLIGKHLLLTNDRGGMVHTPADLGPVHSKYDCLLGANLDPAIPTDRHVLVKQGQAWLRVDGIGHAIDQSCIEALHYDGAACWQLRVPIGGDEAIHLRLHLQMPTGRNTTVMRYELVDAPADDRFLQLVLRFALEDRSFHQETVYTKETDRHFREALSHGPHGCTFAVDGRVCRLHCAEADWHEQPEWHRDIPHPVEAQRGMRDRGDAFSPGWFGIDLRARLTATVVLDAEADAADWTAADPVTIPTSAQRSMRELLREACGHYVVRRESWRTVIAGYPWFLDWGRDTLICARGLLAAGLVDEVQDILTTFGRFAEAGTLPNCIHGADASNRDTSDAPLWFGVVCEDLAELRGMDIYRQTVDEDGRDLVDVLLTIARGYRDGTPNQIAMDPDSGLIWSPSHFTWMDTNYPASTPRQGYPVEIQALWWRLLRQLARLAPDDDRIGSSWGPLAEQAYASLQRYYWNAERGWIADSLQALPGGQAAKAEVDGSLRCNAMLAIALDAFSGTAARGTVLAAAQYLVIPGAIRSLAPLPVELPLPVHDTDGKLLNDPFRPYWSVYGGDEDSRRKPAYHNGTAWSWPFPSFCEALIKAFPDDAWALAAAGSYLGSIDRLLDEGCVGHIPEVLDGDAPHAQRGCDAQAWSATEALRVWSLLGLG